MGGQESSIHTAFSKASTRNSSPAGTGVHKSQAGSGERGQVWFESDVHPQARVFKAGSPACGVALKAVLP